MDKEVRLSSSEFKALASETRASIIKLLRERNHTMTEISKKLRLAAPTIKQHLGILECAELIEELDEGRKWKYYSLTRKGKNIFSPETPVNVLIVLAVSVLCIIGLMNSFLIMMETQEFGIGGQVVQSPMFIEEAEKLHSAMETDAGAIVPDSISGTVNRMGFATDAAGQITATVAAIMIFSLLAGYFIAKIRE